MRKIMTAVGEGINSALDQGMGFEIVCDFGEVGEYVEPVYSLRTVVDLRLRSSEEWVWVEIRTAEDHRRGKNYNILGLTFPTFREMKEFFDTLPVDPIAVIGQRPYDPEIDQCSFLGRFFLKITGGLKNYRQVFDEETIGGIQVRISVERNKGVDTVSIKGTSRGKYGIRETSVTVTPEIFTVIRDSVLGFELPEP